MIKGYQSKSYKIEYKSIKNTPYINIIMAKEMYKQMADYCNRLYDINFNMRYRR